MKKIILFVLIATFMSCKQRFDGKNEQTIKESKEKILKELNDTEKKNLESALNVLSFVAYRIEKEVAKHEKRQLNSFSIRMFHGLTHRVKKEDLEKYKGLTSKDISFKMIDGLTYVDVLDLVENIFKNDNKDDIDETSKLIDSLNLKKAGLDPLKQKQYDVFKIISKKVIETENPSINEMTPQLEIEFQYSGENELTGEKWIDYGIEAYCYTKQTSTTRSFQTSETSHFDEIDIKNGDTVKGYFFLDNLMSENYPQKFPIESSEFPDYGLEVTLTINEFYINGKEIKKPEITIPKIDAEIKENQLKLDELKAKTAPYFKLEATDKEKV